MYSRHLAKFASELRYEDLSRDVEEMAKKCIMDLLGVALAGHNKQSSIIWSKLNSKFGTKAEASVWSPGFPKTNFQYAAAINSAFGHAIDMDDVHNQSIVHLGVITIPTAIAVGQHLNKCGKDVIAAIVAGYDVGARIGEAINPSSYWYWHTTSVVGGFSSAAVAGNLMGLNDEEMNHGFGSAGSQASGLWEFSSDGAMTKTLHVAKASLNGIISAELACEGFTGASRILEGSKGLINAIAQKYDLNKLTADFARPYKIMENSFKPYACCRHTHSANYAIEEMVKKYKINAGMVKSITDRTYKTALDITDNANPQTPYAYKFSLQYCIAACLVYGNLFEEVFTPEKINNPLIKETMNKIKVCADREINDEFLQNPDKWIHDLEIETTDGRILKERIDYPIGDSKKPFDWDMTENKFRMLTESFLSEKETDELIAKIHSFEELHNVNDLFKR